MGQIFTKACYVTAGVNSFLSMVPALASWRRKALGPGDRRPDGIVAALLAHAAWFSFGRIQASPEAMWLNGMCGSFQFVNLVTYAVLCTRAERLGLPKRLVCAAAYLCLTLRVGLTPHSSELFGLLCTLSGIVATFVPWFITVYMTEPRTRDLLPHWGISVFSVINGMAWFARGLDIWNIPMAVQNVAGAFCSLWILVLLFVRKVSENKYPPLLANEASASTTAVQAATEANLIQVPETLDTAKSCSSEKVDESLTQYLHKPSDDASTSGSKELPIDVKKQEAGDNGTAPSETSLTPATTPATDTEAAAKIIKEAGGNDAAPNETSPTPASNTEGAKIVKEAGGNGTAPSESSTAPPAAASAPVADTEGAENVKKKTEIIEEPNTE